MKSTDYIKFVVSKVEEDFLVYSKGMEYVKVITVLQALKASEDIVRDVFILTGTKKLRQLSHYILFVLKKYESGRITLDNFLENLNADKLFITNYLHTFYNLEIVESPVFTEEEQPVKKFIFDSKQDFEEPVYSLAENNFYVEQMDNELITEEFSEIDIAQEDESGIKMELINKISSEEFIPDTEDENVYMLPEPNSHDEKNQANHFAQDDNENDISKNILPDKLNDNESMIKTGLKDKENIDEEIDKDTHTDKEIPESAGTIVLRTDNQAEDKQSDNEKDINKKLEEIESGTSNEIINSRFQIYQKEVFENNKTLRGLLEELEILFDSSETESGLKREIHNEIHNISNSLSEISRQMSFEIITKVYRIISVIFEEKFEKLISQKEFTRLIQKGLEGIEKLINGEELGGFEEVIKELDETEKDFNRLLKSREEYEKKLYKEKEEIERDENIPDNSERDTYLALREEILELENNVNKIYQNKNLALPFEFLRKLSLTFKNFREIVNISRVLELYKIAQLSESGYSFVKFLQNYRIDPYQSEVSEVFRYLIYCLKLIYLDKPVKDLDIFISYLNDPVKIFHNKNKN